MITKAPITNLRRVHMGEPQFESADVKKVLNGFANREMLLKMLQSADVGDAVGSCLAYLLHMVDTNPQVLKTVLRSRISKPGRPDGDIIDILNRVSK